MRRRGVLHIRGQNTLTGALRVVLAIARGGQEVRAAAAAAMAAETALRGHAARPRQQQEAFQLIFTHRKNARHRRAQIACGCFYGAGSALGVAEARGGPSNRARWPAGPREGRFAAFTSFWL